MAYLTLLPLVLRSAVARPNPLRVVHDRWRLHFEFRILILQLAHTLDPIRILLDRNI